MSSYQIHISLKKNIEIQIGQLGIFKFPRGLYIYSGSAKKNIDQRIKRHLLQSKKLFWHIDYFLANKDTEIIKIEKKNISECDLNKNTKGKSIVCGFGSSDCINNCKSHLIYKNNN